MGASMRLLLPKPPDSERPWLVPILGITIGLVLSLLYLLPQLIQGTGVFLPDPQINDRIGAIRVQYISSVIIAFLAGLGFDYAWGRLIEKSKQETNTIANGKI